MFTRFTVALRGRASGVLEAGSEDCVGASVCEQSVVR